MAELYALGGHGEGAAHQLRTFWESICSPNGFHLNGDYKRRGVSCMHYRPFTLEANLCAADALQEMLLQTEGGLRISASMEDGAVTRVTFRAQGVGSVRLHGLPGGVRMVAYPAGETVVYEA